MSTTERTIDEEWAASFGATLRSERERAGLSRSKLARLLDVAEKNVENWETGRILPGLMNYRRIIRVLPALGDMGRFPWSLPEPALQSA